MNINEILTVVYAGFSLTVAPYVIYRGIKSIKESREFIKELDTYKKNTERETKEICNSLQIIRNNRRFLESNPQPLTSIKLESLAN
jgi:hypothetical protein